MSLLDGQVLEGKYVITRRIAEGGMSTVYLGVHQRIGKDVAVKVLHADVARDREIAERFEREARIVSRIKSPHVADVFDFGELPSGERFMVMEYLEGESLATRLERDKTVPPRMLALIAGQILDALVTTHAAGVIHRDLKPENIIITMRGRGGNEAMCKLVDFGISKVIRSNGCAQHHQGLPFAQQIKLTGANAVLGTPLYMSPEQARGSTAQIDHRTDLYALGVILYEATYGEPPLMGDNVNDLLFRIALDEPTPLELRVPSVDPALAAIVRKAMAKNPSDRWSSAEEMRDAVQAWQARIGAQPQQYQQQQQQQQQLQLDKTMPAIDTAGPPSSTPLSVIPVVVTEPSAATPMSLVVPQVTPSSPTSVMEETGDDDDEVEDNNNDYGLDHDDDVEFTVPKPWIIGRPLRQAFLAVPVLVLVFGATPVGRRAISESRAGPYVTAAAAVITSAAAPLTTPVATTTTTQASSVPSDPAPAAAPAPTPASVSQPSSSQVVSSSPPSPTVQTTSRPAAPAARRASTRDAGAPTSEASPASPASPAYSPPPISVPEPTADTPPAPPPPQEPVDYFKTRL